MESGADNSKGRSEDPQHAAESSPNLDFLWRTHQHLQETIRFVDGKAIALFVVTGIFVASLAASGAAQSLPVLWRAISFLALALVAISVFAALITILPRTGRTSEKNVLSPDNLRADFVDHSALAEFLNAQHSSGFAKQLCVQLVALSEILHRKLRTVRLAVTCLLAGVALAVPAVVAHQYWLQRVPAPAPLVAQNLRRTSLQKITVAQFGDLLMYLPLYIAKSEGLFSDQQLDVTILSTGGDDKTFAAVAAGQAAFGIADPTFAAIAASNGAGGRVLGILIDGVPNYAVSLKSTPAVRSIADIATLRIASVQKPSTSYALTEALLDQARSRRRPLQVAASGLQAALAHGDADLAVLIEPWVSTVARNGGSVVLNFSDYFPRFALTGITTSDAVIRANPDMVRRFLTALRRATDIFYSDPDRTLAAAQRMFSSEDPRDLRSGIDRHRRDRIYPPALAIDPRAWEAAISLRVRSADLKPAADGYRSVLAAGLDGSAK